MLSERMNNFINKEIFEYVELFSQKEPKLLKELNRETNLKVLNPRMLSGAYQGRILSMISKLLKPINVLEVGTGYSAICIWEGLDPNGISHTIDTNEELESIQRKYFNKSKKGNKIIQYSGDALKIIPALNESFDLIFIDADKENYINYFNLVINKLNQNGVLISDNVLWSGKVLEKTSKNDTATKTLVDYNNMINNDSRVETIILPIRDGISICRKI